MPVFYLDTSALVKRYVQEKGSEVLDELFDNLATRGCGAEIGF
ncbi:MAG: hypothetical protein HW384_2184 [Dehalococcoidia bacterium]|nr:hypothetical protein [Dehalococcoidia bacterium]